MAWSTEQLQTESDVFWDILRIHQWYTQQLCLNGAWPEKKIVSQKRAQHQLWNNPKLYLKKTYLFCICRFSRNPLFAYERTHAKAFRTFFQLYVPHQPIFFGQHFCWPKINKIKFGIWTKQSLKFTVVQDFYLLPSRWLNKQCLFVIKPFNGCPCPFWRIILSLADMNWMTKEIPNCPKDPVHLLCFDRHPPVLFHRNKIAFDWKMSILIPIHLYLYVIVMKSWTNFKNVIWNDFMKGKLNRIFELFLGKLKTALLSEKLFLVLTSVQFQTKLLSPSNT